MPAGGKVGPMPWTLNCSKSFDQQNDWKMQRAFEDGLFPSRSIPDTVDLRADWWEIGNQYPTNSCIGWSTTDAVLRYHLVKQNLLNPKDRLSVWLTWMAAKETDIEKNGPTEHDDGNGVCLKAGLEVLRNYGAVLESELPHDTNLFAQKFNNPEFIASASARKIKAYYNLQYDEVANLDNFRLWIAHQGPIIAMSDLDDNFMKLDGANINGAYLNRYDKPDKDNGHALAIVGYTKDHFIIRNSWGHLFGQGGFAYMHNDYITNGGLCEAYGIVL